MTDDERIAELSELVLKGKDRPDWNQLVDELFRLLENKQREAENKRAS